jgi:hypothetical protein
MLPARQYGDHHAAGLVGQEDRDIRLVGINYILIIDTQHLPSPALRESSSAKPAPRWTTITPGRTVWSPAADGCIPVTLKVIDS